MRRVPIALLLLAVMSSTAHATSISLMSGFTEFMGSTSGSLSCNSTSSLSVLTDSCNHTMSIPNVTGHFSATTFASATWSGAFELHASSDASVWVTNSLGTPGTLLDGYAASAVSRAAVLDSISVAQTGTIQSGFLRFTFDVTGTRSRLTDINTLDGFNPSGTAAINGTGTNSAFLLINGVSASVLNGGTVVIDVPLDFGSLQPVDMALQIVAAGQIFSTYQGVRSITDFANTSMLVSTVVLDGNKNLINGAVITSEGGIDYRSGPAAVPEPGSVALLTTGLFVLAVRRMTLRRG